MTTLATEAPPLLVASAGEVGRSPGRLWREAARCLVLVDDNRLPARNGLVVPPYLADRVLEFLGIDPATVPPPGAVADSLGPEA